MQEANAFSGHGVLVSACHVEGPGRHLGQVGRTGHKTMIAIDDDECFAVWHGRNERVDLSACGAAGKKDLRHEDEVVFSACRRRPESRRKAFAGLRRHVRAHHASVFLKAGHLSAKTVELAIRRKYTNGTAWRKAREYPAHEFMRIGCNCDRGVVWEIEDGGNSLLQGREQLAEHDPPLVAGKASGIFPTAQLRLEGDIRPLMMTMRCKVDAPWIGATETGEVRAKIEGRHRF
jgi:hypothetical protein